MDIETLKRAACIKKTINNITLSFIEFLRIGNIADNQWQHILETTAPEIKKQKNRNFYTKSINPLHKCLPRTITFITKDKLIADAWNKIFYYVLKTRTSRTSKQNHDIYGRTSDLERDVALYISEKINNAYSNSKLEVVLDDGSLADMELTIKNDMSIYKYNIQLKVSEGRRRVSEVGEIGYSFNSLTSYNTPKYIDTIVLCIAVMRDDINKHVFSIMGYNGKNILCNTVERNLLSYNKLPDGFDKSFIGSNAGIDALAFIINTTYSNIIPSGLNQSTYDPYWTFLSSNHLYEKIAAMTYSMYVTELFHVTQQNGKVDRIDKNGLLYQLKSVAVVNANIGNYKCHLTDTKRRKYKKSDFSNIICSYIDVHNDTIILWNLPVSVINQHSPEVFNETDENSACIVVHTKPTTRQTKWNWTHLYQIKTAEYPMGVFPVSVIPNSLHNTIMNQLRVSHQYLCTQQSNKRKRLQV